MTKANIPHIFVSNTTKESKGSLRARLKKLGFDIPDEKLFTSLTATHDFLKENNLRPYSLLTEDACADFKDLCAGDPNCVVIGLAPERFSYEEINKAFQ